MTDVDDWSEPYHDREPDPSDYAEREAEGEYWEHRDQVHGGRECDCRPSVLDHLRRKTENLCRTLRYAPARLRFWSWRPRTVRLGPVEVTVRLNARDGCGACHGKGWFYTKTGIDPDPMPEGYDGVGLCGCGAAIGKLASARRVVRQAQNEPPF